MQGCSGENSAEERLAGCGSSLEGRDIIEPAKDSGTKIIEPNNWNGRAIPLRRLGLRIAVIRFFVGPCALEEKRPLDRISKWRQLEQMSTIKMFQKSAIDHKSLQKVGRVMQLM
ncbi:hypothetical protein ACLOJK_001367 [Asimina triloba]